MGKFEIKETLRLCFDKLSIAQRIFTERSRSNTLKFLFILLTSTLLLSLPPKPHTPPLAGLARLAEDASRGWAFGGLNPGVLAAGTECQVDASANARASGLISIGADSALTGKFGNASGICAYDPKAAFISFKLPTYQELKSKYFDQSKASKVTFTGTLPPISDQTVYYTTGNFTASSSSGGSGTAVIFIDGTINIDIDIIYGTATTGLVFVVGGNVNIAATVTRVDAVIISQGQIFTAGASCTNPTSVEFALTVNGSLISLDSSKPIRFCRSLGVSDSTIPAEVINHQSKYVVILRDLFSGTLQKWTEIAGVPFIAVQLPTPTLTPTPVPTATPIPTPTPTPTPSPTPAATPALALVGNSQSTGTVSWNQDCGTGTTYRMLIVATAEWRGNSTSQVASFQYGFPSQSLTKLGQSYNTSTGALVTMWYLINPYAGINLIIPTTGDIQTAYGSSCWQGASQVAPANFTTSFATSGTASISIPSTTTADKVVDGVAVLCTQTLVSSQTQLANIGVCNAKVGHSYKTGTSTSTSMVWSNVGAEGRWAMVGARLLQAL